ncbi:MAG: DNA repair protein RecN [Magnetococcales bacterium]|nr:DNA repair protein RecN [Magnetococcales bacterium]
MLAQITIDNIALIDHLDLELSDGLTVITGETGAGKSILLDALGLVLGARADTALVRTGAEKAVVSARFYLPTTHPAHAWVQEQALEQAGEEIFLRRIVAVNGRGRAFINETAVPVNALERLGTLLVDLHGQHEHQSLLHSGTHLAILDAFAGHDALLAAMGDCYRQWRRDRHQLDELRQRLATATERRTFLTFQLEEMERVNLQVGELEQLKQRKNWLLHGSRLMQSVENALALLSCGEKNAVERLHRSASELENSLHIDAELASLAERSRNVQYEVEAIAEEIVRYQRTIHIDPSEMEKIEQRLDLIYQLCRKHRREAHELAELALAWRQELDQLEDAEDQEQQLKQRLSNSEQQYQTVAAQLTSSRHNAVDRLTAGVMQQLQELYMATTQMVVQVTTTEGVPKPSGNEMVEFLISTNPGEPVKPLKQVASGGEMARIMLALKSVLADAVTVDTLIFDEIDSGISGRVAAAAGEKLYHIGSMGRQVIAITHLPQVAAWGSHHLRVAKQVRNDKTYIDVQPLSPPQRIEEVARLLAGDQITDSARDNAKELLMQAGRG